MSSRSDSAILAALGFVLLALSASTATAHLKLLVPMPRSSDDPNVQSQIDIGYIYSSPPCGDLSDIPVGEPTARLIAGSDAVISVEIHQQHASQVIQLFLSYDDETFSELTSPSAPIAGAVNYPDGGFVAPPRGTTHLAVALPQQTSQRATLRAWDNYAFFSCSDVEVVSTLVFEDGFEAGDLGKW